MRSLRQVHPAFRTSAAAVHDLDEPTTRRFPGEAHAGPHPDGGEPGAPWRTRRQDLAPWGARRPPAGDPRDGGAYADTPPEGTPPTPVFVDDSGRRHRLGRRLAWGLVGGVALYTVVIALGLSGVLFVGRLAPPGLDRLARPAGDTGVVTGPDAVEAELPADPAATTSGERDAGTIASTDAATAPSEAAPTTAAETPTTTTTVATTSTTPGNSTTSTSVTPSSTAPPTTSHPRGSGRPDSPPGQG